MPFGNMYRPQANPLAISPGELRHTVQFAHSNSTQDAFGQPLNKWTPYLTIHAKVENLSGQELYQQGEFSSNAIWRITVRWPGAGKTIRVGDRVLYTNPSDQISHAYVVQIINNVQQRNRVLLLTCLEIDGAS